MTSISSLWFGNSMALGANLNDEESSIALDILRAAIIDEGAGGVTLKERRTPPYSESAYFACNIYGHVPEHKRNSINILSKMSQYIESFKSNDFIFSETKALGFEYFTIYYCIAMQRMLGLPISNDLSNMSVKILNNFLSNENDMQNDICSFFWLIGSLFLCSALPAENSRLCEHLQRFKSQDYGYGSLPLNLENGSLSATGRALLIGYWLGCRTDANISNFVERCVQNRSFTETINSGATWEALKWGSVSNYLLDHELDVSHPKLFKKMDLWKLHVSCISRSLAARSKSYDDISR